jgi:hypothetical protein
MAHDLILPNQGHRCRPEVITTRRSHRQAPVGRGPSGLSPTGTRHVCGIRPCATSAPPALAQIRPVLRAPGNFTLSATTGGRHWQAGRWQRRCRSWQLRPRQPPARENNGPDTMQGNRKRRSGCVR